MDSDSAVLASSGAAVAAAMEVVEAHGDGEDGGGGGRSVSNSAEEDKSFKDINEEGERNFGGNRWPRNETLALLKIRSDMDAVFRDSTHKAPLWDEVSRKLGELGFNRSAKKCKEKFENVYKYHKRTKEVRSGKSINKQKVYKFSDELEALDNHQISFQSSVPQSTAAAAAAAAIAFNPPWTVSGKISTVPSPINPTKTSQINSQNFAGQININSTTFPSNSLPPKYSNSPLSSLPNMSANVLFSSSTSSSTASDEDPLRRRQWRKRKRKWTDFFLRLTKEVIEKQEGLQLKFLEALERIENQRKLRDEAWRMKEVSRVNKEHEILVQEMSMAAAKDAAVVAFLQKITPQSNTASPPPFPPPPPPLQLPPPPPPLPMNIQNGGNNNGIITTFGNSSRWPKTEVEALIKLRTELELKYQDNGAKGPLWEEISSAMGKLGYSRSAKRCKEKWENINKYFKKVKDSNKKRPEDAKTCPYFHQLDALYREKFVKNSFDINNQMEPLMVEPEQQWPPPLQGNHIIMGNIQRINSEENHEEEEEDGSNSSTDVEDHEEEEEQSPISISNTA